MQQPGLFVALRGPKSMLFVGFRLSPTADHHWLAEF
jgi:hypothetical protein